MAKAVDAIVTLGRSVTEAAAMCSVPEAELKHLMRTDPSPLLKQEEDAILLCCMRLSRMGFPISLSFLEARMEDELSKRPQPCQPSPHFQKLSCQRLLQKNQHFFANKLPYQPSDPMSKKLSSYSSTLHKLYQDIEVRKPTSVLAFVMEKYPILNHAGNRVCNVTALSLLSAGNMSLPIMLIFPNVVHYSESVSNLILVGSKEGLPTPNLITHYLRTLFSVIITRPLVIFFNGHENVMSHQLVSECMDNKVFLHFVPQDISSFIFPGNHGGVLHSISANLKDRLVKERDFIDLIYKEMKRAASHNMSQVFAKTGLYPVKPSASIELYHSFYSTAAESEDSMSNRGDSNHFNDDAVNEDDSEHESGDEIEDNNNSQKSDLFVKEFEKHKNSNQLSSHKTPNLFDMAILNSLNSIPNHPNPSANSSNSTAANRVPAATPCTNYLNDGKRALSTNPSKPQKGKGGASSTIASGSVNFSSGVTKNVNNHATKGKKGGSEQNVTLNGPGKIDDKKRGGKRSLKSVLDTDSKVDIEIPSKRQKGGEKKTVASLASLEETINEVIAKSREESEASEKARNSGISNNSKVNSGESKEIPARPSIKIRRSSHGLISVLDINKDNLKGKEEEGGDSDLEDESESSSSDKEMEIDLDGDNESDDEQKELKISHEEDKIETNEFPSDISDEDVEEIRSDEENKDDSMDTSHRQGDESETELVRVKKVKKKKKKKHSHHSSKEGKEKSKSEADKSTGHNHTKKKKKKKRSKNCKKMEEKKEEEQLAVVDMSSPLRESAPDKLAENEQDENERKLQYIRRVSLADHDYDTKFDSDSGTEVVKDDSVEDVAMAAGDGRMNVEGYVDNKEVVVDGEVGNKSLVDIEGPEVVCDKEETSDSDSSSSSSNGDNENESESNSSGSSSSGSSDGSNSGSGKSSSSSSSDSSSDKEEEGKKQNGTAAPVELKVVEKGDVEQEKGGEENDSEEGSSSWGSGASSASDSDDEEGVEQGNSNKKGEEDDDDEEDEDEDSNCQLCMLSNPPHTKETVIDWVDCDGNCGRWFHVICIIRSQAKANPKHYVCPSCRCKR